MPGAAEFAVVAIERGFQRSTVAGMPSGNALAAFHHHAGGLMPHYHGEDARRIAHRAFGIIVNVGAAYSNGCHAHLNLAGRRILIGHFAETELMGGNEFGGDHEAFSYVLRLCHNITLDA